MLTIIHGLVVAGIVVLLTYGIYRDETKDTDQ
jgi:hypothetical protein